jgi:diaminopimelate epimerase
MKQTPFIKMDGLGNDFVIIDGRDKDVKLAPREIAKLGDRKTGIGFDQLFVLHNSRVADIKMDIYNSDGSSAGACGNGTRCVAKILFYETNENQVTLEAPGGKILRAYNGAQITVNMGEPRLNWDEIPLSAETDTLNLPQLLEGFGSPAAVSMGNPHAVFFVDDVAAVNLKKLGPAVENNNLFPEKTNVEFAQILPQGKIRMRVWERGAGITTACGSGACASLVAAVRRGLSARKAEVIMDGGSLGIEWTKEGDVLMTGPVHTAFSGVAFLD